MAVEKICIYVVELEVNFLGWLMMSCGRAQSLVLVLHHQLHILGQLELGVPWQLTFVWPFGNHQSQSTFAVNIDKSHYLC
jgi:Tfp pilus assembly protein PilN